MLPIRSTSKIYLYQFLTFGFYFIYWCQRAGRELNQLIGRVQVPSAWWFALPGFGAYWWMWNYSQTLQTASAHRIKQTDTFLLYVLVTCVFSAPLGIIDGFHDSDAVTRDEVRPFLILIAVMLCVMYILNLIAIGFFCAMVQKKLNTVFGGPATPSAAHPAGPTPGPPVAPIAGPPAGPPVAPIPPSPPPAA